ncbi:MAG: aminopeptidase [Spirochaetales bacterium]|nr:aminopeptidase [Spirochaetales bacterium]
MLFSGCYYMKQGRYLVSHQVKADAVGKLLQREDLPSDVREFLLLVEDIRKFSREELGLKENKNYTTFLDTGKDVLAYVVSACDPLSFQTYMWKYPFLGKMPYKGYYEPQDARREGGRLEERGLDVWIRGVEGFSTLGIFKDPLYKYMQDYPVHRLANLLIHEQTHATVWRKEDISFNEDLASFVGDEGARLYILSRYGEDSDEFKAIAKGEDDYKLFVEDIFTLRDDLSLLYEEAEQSVEPEADTEGFLERKGEIIAVFQEKFRSSYENRYSSDRFLGFADLPINNAYLDLYQIYEGNRAWFEEKYEEAGGDMKVFLASL